MESCPAVLWEKTDVIVAKGLALMFAWLSVLVILGLLISIVRRVVDDKSGNAILPPTTLPGSTRPSDTNFDVCPAQCLDSC